MGDVLSDYHTGDAFDEMVDGEGSVRPSYQAVYSALSRSTSDDLRTIAESLANNYTQAGVTFDVGAWRESVVLIRKLPELRKALADLESRLAALEARLK